jgi:hypothetical protein
MTDLHGGEKQNGGGESAKKRWNDWMHHGGGITSELQREAAQAQRRNVWQKQFAGSIQT